MQQKAALGVVVVAAAWGFVGLFVRWVDLPPVAFVFSRCALAAATLGVFLGCRRLLRGPAVTGFGRTRPAWWGIALLGVLLAAHWLFLVGAQQRAPLGTVLLITYLAPVMVTVLAPRVIGEAVPRLTLLAALVGLLGVAVLVRPGAGFGAGEVLALLAAATYAGLTLGWKRVVGDVGGVRLAFTQLGAAAVVLAPLALTTDWGPARVDWWWLVLVGVVLTAGLSSLYLVLLNLLPAATVGVLTYVEPVSAVLVGWAFLGEVPTVGTLVGGALVVGAGIMVLPGATNAVVAPDGSVPRAAPR